MRKVTRPSGKTSGDRTLAATSAFWAAAGTGRATGPSTAAPSAMAAFQRRICITVLSSHGRTVRVGAARFAVGLMGVQTLVQVDRCRHRTTAFCKTNGKWPEKLIHLLVLPKGHTTFVAKRRSPSHESRKIH
jgi:hypothetical protein